MSVCMLHCVGLSEIGQDTKLYAELDRRCTSFIIVDAPGVSTSVVRGSTWQR